MQPSIASAPDIQLALPICSGSLIFRSVTVLLLVSILRTLILAEVMRNTIITTVTSSHATKRLGSTSKGYQHQSPVQSKSVICWPDWIWPAHGEHWRECRRCSHLRGQHGTPLQIAFFNYIANKSCDGRHWHVWLTFDFGSFLLFSSKTFDDWFCFFCFKVQSLGLGSSLKFQKIFSRARCAEFQMSPTENVQSIVSARDVRLFINPDLERVETKNQ